MEGYKLGHVKLAVQSMWIIFALNNLTLPNINGALRF